jgi:voltage-gated potassium channel Kch
MKKLLSGIRASPAGVTLVALAIVTLGATATYMWLERWSFLTALIFTLSTITTVGYGNVFPQERSAEIFTAALMGVALAAVAVALSTYAARLIRLVARGADPMEQNRRALEQIRNHIVVVAEAAFAFLLAQDLRANGLPFVVVTPDEDLHSQLLSDGVPVLLGDPDEEDVLRRAGIERAAGVIVALPSDADNVFVTLSAHDLNPHIRIAARAHTASSVPKLRRSGANDVVLSEQITAINLVNTFRQQARMGVAVKEATQQLRTALRQALEAPESVTVSPRHVLFRALRLALQELSPGMEDTLYAVGRQFGREAVAPQLEGEQLCDAVQGLPALWTAIGLGQMRVAKCEDTTATLEEGECAACQGMPRVGRPVCNLERGVIAGALEAKLGRSVRTRETKCWGLGDSMCEFEVTADVESHEE